MREIDNGPREACGVFGVFLPGFKSPLIENVTFEGLLANQHRGEESAGIVVANGISVSKPFVKMGLVRDVYQIYKGLPYRPDGFIGLGHTRYSTTGSSCVENAAPYLAHSALGDIAVAHNGNLTNASILRKELIDKGLNFVGTTDSEVLAQIIVTTPGENWEEKIQGALKKCQGSFSLAMITKDAMYAVRDKMGNRPLFFAQIAEGDGYNFGYVVSSETPAFNRLMVDKMPRVEPQEVKPGEIIKFSKSGIKRWRYTEGSEEAFCGLEIAYLLRPDGRLRRLVQVDTVRHYLGRKLAQLHPVPEDIDYVTYIPESSRSTAEGFAEESAILIRTGMLKGRYGTLDGAFRGFINPHDEVRSTIAGDNYFPFDWLSGKKIALIDDSIIRGKTTEGVIKTILHKVGFLRNQGAREIHLRIPWPPVMGACPLGTDINENDWLIYKESGKNIEAVRQYLSVTSLAYLTPEEFQKGVDEAVGAHLGLCMGCVTGKYPVTVFQADKTIFERNKIL